MFRTQEKKNKALASALDRNNGNVEAVREALERGAEVSARFTSRQLTALHLAACLQSVPQAVGVIELLLAKGLSPNATDGYGRTALSYASGEVYYDGRLPVVEKLLAAGTSCGSDVLPSALGRCQWDVCAFLLNRQPELAKNATLLVTALQSGAPASLMEKLVGALPADGDERAAALAGALNAAVASGVTASVQFVLGLPGVDPNAASGAATPLMTAVQKDSVELVNVLVKAGADPNVAAGAALPLMTALQRGNAGVIDALLKAKADPNGGTEGMPLMFAVQRNNIDLVNALLKAGANPGQHDPSSNYPLNYAIRYGYDPIALALLKAGAMPGTQDADGNTALTFAMSRQAVPLVRALVEADTALRAEANDGRAVTKAGKAGAGELQLLDEDDLGKALFTAIENRNVQMFQALLSADKPNLNAVNNKGYTPLMHALYYDNNEIVTALLKAGADTEARDFNDKTALDLAREWNREPATKMLVRLRRESEKRAEESAPVSSDDGRFRMLARDMLEVNQGGLKTVFNFWTQQVVTLRGANDAPATVQNFADIQRQEAVTEAWRKLKELGGDPPDIPETQLQKGSPGLKAG
jgi:ankyrin repeat protein